jgi:steroid 5-alpha reductase family enzyme
LQSVTAFLEWLQALPLAVFIHKKAWAFTTVEVVHVFAIAMVIGTIAIVDLRLLGFASTKRPVAELSRKVLPFTWAAFAIAVVAGSLLFISRAPEYFVNAMFWIKMALIVIAGINMMIFEFITVRGVKEWNLSPTPPLAARLAGGISIACWVLVLIFGRLIAFTLQTE